MSFTTFIQEKAHKAMDELWNMRHRTSNLMGSVLNVDSGDWIRKDSGVGAGIDSYYEYCLKAYILLADEKYLKRFNTVSIRENKLIDRQRYRPDNYGNGQRRRFEIVERLFPGW